MLHHKLLYDILEGRRNADLTSFQENRSAIPVVFAKILVLSPWYFNVFSEKEEDFKKQNFIWSPLWFIFFTER